MKSKTDNDFIFKRAIACDAMVGRSGNQDREYDADVRDLTNEMRRLNVAEAIVRNDDSLDTAPYFCNDMLMRDVSGRSGLIPAWFLTPDGRSPDYSITRLVERMLGQGVKVAWTDPCVNRIYSLRYSFRKWCCGEMLDALQRHKIPLLLGFPGIDLSELHDVMTDFPGLRIILLDIPRLGRQANLEALLKAHPELYLCFGPSYSIHGGYRDLCERYGDHRWVWGMGYPSFEGGAAVTGLVYSGLTPKQIEAVAFGNMQRLLEEVEG